MKGESNEGCRSTAADGSKVEPKPLPDASMQVMFVPRLFSATVCVVLLCGCPTTEIIPPLPDATTIHEEVDVFVGTGGAAFAVGSAFPGPALPFGMVRPGPDTQGASSTMGALHCSGYRAADAYVAGFSHLREHGTGVPDFGAILLTPTIGWDESKKVEAGYRLPKGAEDGRPGYYSVELMADEGAIFAELTTAKRAAVHRYTYPDGVEAGVILDLSHLLPDMTFHEGELTVEDAAGQALSGWLHMSGAYTGRHGGEVIHFAMRFDRPPTAITTWDEAEDLGAFLTFDVQQVEVQVGISFVDVAGAWNNLDQDVGNAGFNEVLQEAEAAWELALGSFMLGGGSAEDRAIFASSAYHAMLMPTLFTDADGRFWGFDDQVHTADGWTFYTDFSLWDTYRTLHPLMNLVEPDLQGDFLRSLLTMYDQVGRVPRWPMGSGTTGGMVGDPQDVLFADALIRGIGVDDVDVDAAMDALLDTASQRGRFDEYDAQGWLSLESGGGSVAVTLEYAWADAALAELATWMGDDALAAELRTRSQGWRNLFDVETGFNRPRHADGSWLDPFDPELFDDAYVEGSAWHYTFMVPHDVDGLVQAFGSEQAVIDKLERFFLEASWEEYLGVSSYYWHGNEPALHSAFLFALLGEPEMSIQWSRWAEDFNYGLGPDGLPGNDDAGTLGAWYVFSTAGLFPIAGTTDYVLTLPRFPVVRIRAGSGWLVTTSYGDGPVERITLDGVDIEGPTISWDQIEGGAEIGFWREDG
jgi:predicted alpha-1,2-mannosidase